MGILPSGVRDAEIMTDTCKWAATQLDTTNHYKKIEIFAHMQAASVSQSHLSSALSSATVLLTRIKLFPGNCNQDPQKVL